MHGDRVWATGGWGNLGAMRTAIGNIPDMPFFTEALNYPAVGFNIDQSIALGVSRLADEVNYINQTCPYAPIVLLGHSQGATVVSHLLTGPSALTSSARAAINSVAIFGDPAYRTGMATNYGNPPNNGLFSQGVLVWPKAALADYRFWGYPYGSINTQGWVYRVREYCLPGDFFCQANPGDSNYAIHNNYGQFGTGVANWVQFMMTSFN